MKVYVALEYDADDSSTILGIFTTRDEAQLAKARMDPPNDYYFKIEERELEGPLEISGPTNRIL